MDVFIPDSLIPCRRYPCTYTSAAPWSRRRGDQRADVMCSWRIVFTPCTELLDSMHCVHGLIAAGDVLEPKAVETEESRGVLGNERILIKACLHTI